MLDIVFVHGWGFDRGLWDEVIPHLADDVLVTNIDLGFTGQAFHPPIIPANALCIGHSMGVTWLLKNVKNPMGLISIGGFDCFYKHTPVMQIKAMKRNLSNDVNKQMKEFYVACGTDFKQHEFNKEALINGLNFLMKADEIETLKNLSCPIMAINAQDDNIISMSMAQTIWSNYNFNAIKTGGHVLPLTQPQLCAKYINDMIEKLRS